MGKGQASACELHCALYALPKLLSMESGWSPGDNDEGWGQDKEVVKGKGIKQVEENPS